MDKHQRNSYIFDASEKDPHHQGIFLDSHLHTLHGATDSSLNPADLLVEAQSIGINGLNITEHDRIWNQDTWESFRSECGDIFLSKGMEVSTDLGHVIVFGVDKYHSGFHSARRLRQISDEIGAFLSVAHPFRHFFNPATFLRDGKKPFNMRPDEAAEQMEIFSIAHGIEVANGGNSRQENLFAYRVAEHLGKPMTGGSDAHSISGIGTFTTFFPEPLTNRNQMLSYLHTGNVIPYEGLNTGQLRPFRPLPNE